MAIVPALKTKIVNAIESAKNNQQAYNLLVPPRVDAFQSAALAYLRLIAMVLVAILFAMKGSAQDTVDIEP